MLTEKLLQELREYVELNADHHKHIAYSISSSAGKLYLPDIQETELEDYINSKRQPIFNQVLFNLIDTKKITDADVYRRAGIDRRLFSKIRSKPQYRPGKNTVIALALALELNKEATDQLLSAAGYSLSDNETYDLVIQFCLEKKIFNIEDVNQALVYFSLKPLGGALD
ncbi:MAG: hypothetical protein KGZ96_08225 [Clostridia bacterium]|nr:hypothetical protein [Clostridia bacterium]